MAVNEHGDVLGSVSGGCVEGAVYAAAQEVILNGKSQTHQYGVSDGDALSVGLTCGGTIEVMIQPERALFDLDPLLADIAAGRPVATVSLPDAQLVVRPDRVSGTLGDPELDRIAGEQARGLLAHGRSAIVTACEREVFVQSWAAPARMIVFRANRLRGSRRPDR